MRAGTVVNLCIYLLGGSVLASPFQPLTAVANAASASGIINKRQIGGGGVSGAGGGDDFRKSRPAEWDNLPPLPPKIAFAYESNAQTELLAFANAGFMRGGIYEGAAWMTALLGVKMTYLSEERIEEIVSNFAQQFSALTGRGVSVKDMLEGRLNDLDLPQLEQQMAEMVRFRQENEDLGAPGQEFWRNPMIWTKGQPIGFHSPFYTLTWSQDRQLIVAKARSGRFNRQELTDYVRSHDPFLAGFESETVDLVKRALEDFNFKATKRRNKQKGFGKRIKDFFRNDGDES